MQENHVQSALQMRAKILSGDWSPPAFRGVLAQTPFLERDAWVDRVLGIEDIPEDSEALPRGCVPYLPCSANILLQLAEGGFLQPSDVFVDIGAGVGRAAILAHLLTGARAVGVEIQPALIKAARGIAASLGLSGVSFVEGDATQAVETFSLGSMFFLYCPFSGERLMTLLSSLQKIASTRRIYVCCIDLPLPEQRWLEPVCTSSMDFDLYQSL
jgi:SAM-dependent methyltransferase